MFLANIVRELWRHLETMSDLLYSARMALKQQQFSEKASSYHYSVLLGPLEWLQCQVDHFWRVL